MSRLYAKDSGLNSHNDSAREASSARGKNNWVQTMIFGSQSANRKDFLENYQYSMTYTQYKKMKAKAESIRQYGWDQKRIVCTQDGMNSRLDEIQAVVLRIRLKDLKKDILKRRNIANLYDVKLSDKFKIIHQASHQESSYHLYIIRVKNREKLMSYMKKRDIFMGIHYYPSNHMNGILKSQDPNLKVTEKISKEVVSLPIFPELSKVKQLDIIKHLNNFLNYN